MLTSSEYQAMHPPLVCHSDLPYEPAAAYHYGIHHPSDYSVDVSRQLHQSYMNGAAASAAGLKEPPRLLSFASYAGSLTSKFPSMSPPYSSCNAISQSMNPYSMRPHDHSLGLTEEAPLRLDFSDTLQMPVPIPPYGSLRQSTNCPGPQLPLEPLGGRSSLQASYGPPGMDNYGPGSHQFFFIPRPPPMTQPTVESAFCHQTSLAKNSWIDRLPTMDFRASDQSSVKPASETGLSAIASCPAAEEESKQRLLHPKKEPVAAHDSSKSSGTKHAKAPRAKRANKLKVNRQSTPKFHCNMCGRLYCRRSTLKAHLRQHSGERPYHCSDCGKRFSQAANLTAHRRVHTGEKPFSCPVCCRPFSQSSSLVTHKRTHTGERPYQCTDCDKAFTDSSTLTKHMRIHTGMKPYQCHICMLRFSQSGNLNRHMKTHSKQAAWPEGC